MAPVDEGGDDDQNDFHSRIYFNLPPLKLPPIILPKYVKETDIEFNLDGIRIWNLTRRLSSDDKALEEQNRRAQEEDAMVSRLRFSSLSYDLS